MNGQAVHGLLHPEAGHLCLQRMPGDDFEGVDTSFGGPSVEGLACTLALAFRKARGLTRVTSRLNLNSVRKRMDCGLASPWGMFFRGKPFTEIQSLFAAKDVHSIPRRLVFGRYLPHPSFVKSWANISGLNARP